MNQPAITALDRKMARICEHCPLCRQARQRQRGLAFWVVTKIETRTCPFCKVYAKVKGRPAHATS